MSTHFMSYVLRLCDRLFDKDSPDAIDRQGQLNQMLTLVLIFHLIMGTSFLKMQEYEKKHPRIIRDVNISFEFTPPPPVAEFKVGQLNVVPTPINLTPGLNQDVGSADRRKATVEKQTIARPKGEERDKPLVSHPVETRLSTSITDAPVSKTTLSPTKADPTQLARSLRYNSNNADLQGTSSNDPVSGAASQGGKVSDENGDGERGGNGQGGEGLNQGKRGFGTGDDQIIGTQDLPISHSVVNLPKGGNIAPYHRALARMLQENWHPGRKNLSLTVNILIARDGTLLSSEIVSSSGSKRIDREAIEMISGLDYEPLPDWFMGEDLLFQFDLNSI